MIEKSGAETVFERVEDCMGRTRSIVEMRRRHEKWEEAGDWLGELVISPTFSRGVIGEDRDYRLSIIVIRKNYLWTFSSARLSKA